MNVFTIKDLEMLSGVKAHTIRIWEQRYSFLKPQRTNTNIRYYSNTELKTILNVSLLNRYGFKISHINKMDSCEMDEKILALSDSEAQREKTLNDLIQYTIDIKTEEFELLIDNCIATKGIEKTIKGIVFGFLEKLGLLWQTNHINPAQEHIVTNIIRQKIILAIEGAFPIKNTNKTAVLFLPEGELHELCLLFMHYLLKVRGIKVYYLGANVPVNDVIYVVDAKNPTFIYSHLTALLKNFNLEKFFLYLNNKLPNSKIIISGKLIQEYKKKVPKCIEFKKSLNEAIDFINNI